MDLAKEFGTQDSRLVDTLKDGLEELLKEEDRRNTESTNISDETKEQMAFLTDPEGVARVARELGAYLYSEDTAATREFLRFFIRRVDLLGGHGRIEYGLPLPSANTTDWCHESKAIPPDQRILLQHAGPSPYGRGENRPYVSANVH